MEFSLVHKSLVFKNSLFGLSKNILRYLAHRHYTVIILLHVIEAGSDNAVKYI